MLNFFQLIKTRMDNQVVHDADKSEFYMQFEDGSRAVLQYQKAGDTLDMYHTEVPPQAQGRGIAKRLAVAAFDYAVEKQYRIQPTCTYLQKFASENRLPQYLALLVTKGRM